MKNIIATQTEIEEEIKKLITDKDYISFVGYTINRLLRKFNIKADKDFSIRGIMISDIIQNVILSFLSKGKRNWNKTKFPDFKNQFYSTLDSEISNTIKTHLEKHNLATEINKSNISSQFNTYENEQYMDQIYIRLEKLGASDEELLLLEPILNKVKREQIANEFGITPQKVTNITKRLIRKLEQIFTLKPPSNRHEPITSNTRHDH